MTCGKQWRPEQRLVTIARCFLDQKTLDTLTQTHTHIQLHIGQLLLSFCHANGSTSEAETKDKPRYTSKIKNKQPSQADKLTVLTCPFPLSTFHLQLAVRYKKTKSCQQQQQKLPTGNWLTLKGSTSQVRKLLFVFCSSFLSLPLSLCLSSSAATCSCLGHC